MPRISMKLTASLVGSLALLLGAACERSTETTPEPAPGTTGAAQEPNSLRPTPTPSTASPNSNATPGNTSPSGNTATPSTPSAAAPMEEPDTVPVHGTDPDMQGGGAGGAAGHGGQGGHSGHGGKSSR